MGKFDSFRLIALVLVIWTCFAVFFNTNFLKHTKLVQTPVADDLVTKALLRGSQREEVGTSVEQDAEPKPEANRDAGYHKVAGLSCSKYGGPSDDIAAEMVYWSDIPSDSHFVSPFRDYGPKNKFLTFEPDEGGWNNIRMSMETAVAMAHAMGRTLVMPPEQKIYLLDKQNNKKNTFSFSDFFHFESVALEHAGVEVISTQEFLEKQVSTGNIRSIETGEILKPPENRTNWNGIGTFHDATSKKLGAFLKKTGVVPMWSFDKCIAVFPEGPGQKTDHLKAMSEDILKEKPANERIAFFHRNPTPVDGSVKDRMREDFADRKEICLYNDTLQNEPVLHFLGDNNSGVRLLVHFYALLFFENWKVDLWTKRFVRDHLRYVDEIQCAAARVVNAVRHVSKRNGNNGAFDTFHIRRGDFQYKETRIDANQIYENVKDILAENSTVYIATDDHNKTFFDPLREHYKLYFLDDFMDEVGDLNTNFYGMLDQRIASRGETFFGTYYSTFTGYIHRMRGYHSQKDRSPGYEKGEMRSYYLVPIQYKHAVSEYQAISGPYWAREFPVGWRDIDKGIEELHEGTK